MNDIAKMMGRTPVHLSADYALCVLNGYPALGVIHEDYESDHENEDYDDNRYERNVEGRTGVGKLGKRGAEGFRQVCDDTGEEEH